jgi:RHS repeat-associated protein
VGAISPTYSGNGNLTFDGTFTYGYDAENRLTSGAQGGTGVATYAFDAQGRRKLKTVGGTTTVYVTDASNREVLEYDGSSGQIQRWYAYGLGSNDVLNQMNIVAATRATFIPDIQGSILATLDSSSGALSKAGYLPYGKSASTPASFGYTGQRADPETNGLYYYRARMYVPAWGRFIQTDPLGYAAGGNLYAYVGNDPLNLLDSRGLSTDSPQAASNQVPNGAFDAGNLENPIVVAATGDLRGIGPNILPLPDRPNWSVVFSQGAMQHVLERHAFDATDPTAGRYRAVFSSQAGMMNIAAETLNRGTIVGPGNAPDTIAIRYDFANYIGETGAFGGQVNQFTSTNTMILYNVPGVNNLYMVVTQFPTR